MQKDMPVFLEGAWFVSLVDVESTLRKICKKVLTDTSLGKDARKRRAQALRRLGELFLEAASEESKSADGTVKTLRERLAEMMPAEMSAAGDPSGAAGAGGEDDDDDFPDLDGPDTPRAAGGAGSSSSSGGGGGAAAVPVTPPSRDVLAAMSIKELRAVLVANGISSEGMLEKSEYVDAIMAAYEAQSDPSAEAARAAAELASGSPTKV